MPPEREKIVPFTLKHLRRAVHSPTHSSAYARIACSHLLFTVVHLNGRKVTGLVARLAVRLGH